MKLVPELLEILACPKCKGPLQATGDSLVCLACRMKFAIRDGIPILLVEEAESLDEE